MCPKKGKNKNVSNAKTAHTVDLTEQGKSKTYCSKKRLAKL